MAQAELDQAKAGHTQAQADKSSLDFIEQETGVTHLRDTQKIGTQAQGNIELERVKAQLNDGGNAANNGTPSQS